MAKTLLTVRKQEILRKLDALRIQAKALWGVYLPVIQVKFDLKGGVAGWACVRGGYTLRFNTDMMLNEGWDHIINDTVPHELAHLIGYHMGFGLNHQADWKRICIALGGSGKRCHNEKIVFAKGATFEYTTITGKVIPISQTRHKRIQERGTVYLWNDGSKIDKNCKFKKVA
jgi:predicted SprT family Zn-dependent metalloprotease